MTGTAVNESDPCFDKKSALDKERDRDFQAQLEDQHQAQSQALAQSLFHFQSQTQFQEQVQSQTEDRIQNAIQSEIRNETFFSSLEEIDIELNAASDLSIPSISSSVSFSLAEEMAKRAAEEEWEEGLSLSPLVCPTSHSINLSTTLNLNDSEAPFKNFNENDLKLNLPAALCDALLIQEIKSIPKKMGFKIGEVADRLEIKQYVLRYWESEFEILKPKKAANNQRFYTHKDFENAFIIRKLLHRDRFSIEGARSALKDVKYCLKKEKSLSSLQNKIDLLQENFDELLIDIRRIKILFS